MWLVKAVNGLHVLIMAAAYAAVSTCESGQRRRRRKAGGDPHSALQLVVKRAHLLLTTCT